MITWECNLTKTDNFMVQDKTEYTFTEDIESEQWRSKNSVAFDSDTNRNNDNNTYCNRIIPTFNRYMGCNIYEASAGNVTNGSITGTVTKDSTIKSYVDQYVATLALGSNLLEGRLIKKDELINLGCSESEQACPIEQNPWITSISYWTQTIKPDNSYELWTVTSVPGEYSFSAVDAWAIGDDVWGIRPIIKLKKEAF